MPQPLPFTYSWLFGTTAQIDANFQQVLKYLRSSRNNEANKTDQNYLVTLDRIRRRASELVAEESCRPVSAEEIADKERDVTRSKILSLYLVSEQNPEVPTFKEAFFALLLHLMRRANDGIGDDELVRISLEVLSCEKIKSTGISWDIFDLFSTDILAHRIKNGFSLIDDPHRYVSLERNGILRANVGTVLLAPVNLNAMKSSTLSLVPSLSFFQNCLQVLDSKSNRIKQDESNDIEKIKAFADSFVKSQASVKPTVYNNPSRAEDKDVVLGDNLARLLCRLLYFYQRTLRSAVDRYRLLCTCRILANLVNDEAAAKYIEFVAAYLDNIVAFADDAYDKMSPLEYDMTLKHEEGVLLRISIVKILMEYGKGGDSKVLNDFIDEDADQILVKLSRLVQSANRIQNVVPDNLLVQIKKEIISNLSIDSEKKTDLEVNKGIYYGNEDATKEFKPSFFEAPDGCKHQQPWNIFKELCAFLNSELGGTLFMGVADSGYALGLERDLLNLRKIGNRSYADNLDGYKRYILDNAKKFFPNNAVLMNLNFTPVDDERVLAIKVEPWQGGIVEMDGKAFIRMDSESIVMDSHMRDEVVRKKLLYRKDESGNVRNLIAAMEDRKKVILHGYSSSRATEDRLDMEPFAFDDKYQTIWCYDPTADKCKSYKVSRIGSVEVLDKDWTNDEKHRRGETDIFRMTGEKGILVRLQLDLYSKLLICEEFPKVIDLLVPNPEKTSWYLETEVRSLAGIGRFYIGLGKNHINIVDSPELEEYVKKYVQENL